MLLITIMIQQLSNLLQKVQKCRITARGDCGHRQHSWIPQSSFDKHEPQPKRNDDQNVFSEYVHAPDAHDQVLNPKRASLRIY
jgi:hypothetical protein